MVSFLTVVFVGPWMVASSNVEGKASSKAIWCFLTNRSHNNRKDEDVWAHFGVQVGTNAVFSSYKAKIKGYLRKTEEEVFQYLRLGKKIILSKVNEKRRQRQDHKNFFESDFFRVLFVFIVASSEARNKSSWCYPDNGMFEILLMNDDAASLISTLNISWRHNWKRYKEEFERMYENLCNRIKNILISW